MFTPRAAVMAFLVVVAASPFLSAAEELAPEVMQQYQKIYVRERSKELDKLLTQMSQSSGVHLADRNFTTIAVPCPSGERVFLGLSRVGPDPMDKWLFMIVEPASCHVGMVFDFLKAFGIQRILWLDDWRLLVLARNHNLSGPPGRLFHINLRNGRADMLDDFVWRFTISKSKDDIVYERSDDPREPYGVRNLYHLQVSTRDRRRIYQVRHPAVQFGELGPFKGEGSFVKFRVDTYGKDSFEPTRQWFWYDLLAGKAFKDTEAMGTVPTALEQTTTTTAE